MFADRHRRTSPTASGPESPPNILGTMPRAGGFRPLAPGLPGFRALGPAGRRHHRDKVWHEARHRVKWDAAAHEVAPPLFYMSRGDLKVIRRDA